MAEQWYYHNVQYVVVKNQEAKRVLSNLAVRTPLTKLPILGDILFQMCLLNCMKQLMNEIANKFLLPGDTFIPEMHLKQPGFTYSACEPFTKNKERIQKFKETGDISYN